MYGTLRQGDVNHYLLEGAEYLGEHRTLPQYRMIDLGDYPGVTTGGDTVVRGEVYVVNPTQLKRLDELEDYPHLYDRKLIDTPWGAAWIYLFRASGTAGKIITHGDWLRHVESADFSGQRVFPDGTQQ